MIIRTLSAVDAVEGETPMSSLKPFAIVNVSIASCSVGRIERTRLIKLNVFKCNSTATPLLQVHSWLAGKWMSHYCIFQANIGLRRFVKL